MPGRGIRIDRVFYELELDARTFQRGLDDAEKSGMRFAKFMLDHPVAAVGTLVAAFVALEIKATQSAAAVDANIRKVAGSLPMAAGRMSALNKEILDLARSGAATQTAEELSAALAEIAKSAASPEDAMTRLKAVIEATDATGADLHATIEGLDLVLDAFGITGDQSQVVLAKLVTAAQGRVPLEQLFDVLAKAAPTLNALHISMDQSVSDIVALTDAGVPARQSAMGLSAVLAHLTSMTVDQQRVARDLGLDLTETGLRANGLATTFKELVEKTGMQAETLHMLGFETGQFQIIQVAGTSANADFARSSIDAATALKTMDDAARLNRGSAEALAKTIRSQLGAELVELGNLTLPAVSKELAGVIGFLNTFNGTISLIHLDAANARVLTLAANLKALTHAREGERLDEEIRRTKELTDATEALEKAIRAAMPPGGTNPLIERLLPTQVKDWDPARVETIRKGLQSLVDVGALTDRQLELVKRNITTLTSVLPFGPPAPDSKTPRPTAAKGEGTAAGTKPTRRVFTEQQQAMVEDAEKALAAVSRTLADDLQHELDAIARKVANQFGNDIPPIVVAQLKAMREKVAELRILEPLQQEFQALQERAQKAAIDSGEGVMGATLAELDSIIARTAVHAGIATEEQRKALDLLKQEQAMRSQILAAQKQMVTAATDDRVISTLTKVDDLQVELAHYAEEAKKKFTDVGKAIDAEVLTRIARMKQEIKDQSAFEALESDFDSLKANLDKIISDGGMKRVEMFVEMDRSRISKHLEGLQQGTVEYGRWEAKLREIDGWWKEISAKLEKAGHKGLADMARQIQEISGGVVDLANALGVLDDRSSSVLNNIGKIAAGVAEAVAGAETSNPTELIAGIASAAGALAQMAKALFGQSDEEIKAQAELAARLKDNAIAVDELRKHIGDLGNINVTGNQFRDVREALTHVTTGAQKPVPPAVVNTPHGPIVITSLAYEQSWESVARDAGMSLKDFTEFAKQFGISITDAKPSMEEFKALLDAMKASEIAEFAQTFTGQMEALQAEFSLFDVNNPVDQLKELQKVLDDPKFGSPALKKALAGLDLTTPEGRAAADKMIQALFRQLQAGTLNPDDLGGLTAEQFLQELLQSHQLIKDANTSAGAGGQTSQFSVDRTITEASSSRIAALLTTGNAWLQSIDRSVKEVTAALGRMTVYPPLQPPPMSSLAGFGQQAIDNSVVINIAAIHITTTTNEPTRLSKAIVDALEQELTQRLGVRLVERRRLRGDMRVM